MDRIEIEAKLRAYLPSVYVYDFTGSDDVEKSFAEFDSELPNSLVDELSNLGAEVLVYRHHGVTATIVNF